MRGLGKFWGDLHTIFDICEDLPRSGEVSRPAPENSLALIYDNPRKLTIDRRQLALSNIGMKSRKKFNITEWQKANNEKREEWRKHWKVIKWHPLTWFPILIMIAYALDYLGIA